MKDIRDSVEIDVPVEDFYAVITDFESYPSFLNDVDSARLLSRRGEVYDVEFTVHIIRRLDYVLRLVGEPNSNLTWSFLSGQMFKKNDGSWTLEDLGGRTRATYTVDVELNRFVPKAIGARLVQFRLPSMLQEWKQRAESLAGGG